LQDSQINKEQQKIKENLTKKLFERLDIAMSFEKENKIVIPETTAIIRDIVRVAGIEISYNAKKSSGGSMLGGESFEDMEF